VPGSPLSAQTTELIEILQDGLRLRSRLKVVPPEAEQGEQELPAALREWKARSHAAGQATPGGFDLFYGAATAIARQGTPMTMGELSQALGTPMSTATRVVDALVEQDFVERRPDPGDRRVVRVTLTATGQTLYDAANTYLRKRAELLLRRFTPRQRENLLALLHKLIEILEERE
jgi:DNA-binding MarR family transcriptional regulator